MSRHDWTASGPGTRLYLGIDASPNNIGVAWQIGESGEVGLYTLDGIATFETDHPVRELAELYGPGISAHVAIECPTWSGFGTREVRSAVTQIEKRLQRWFPVRSIRRVDPNVWQRMLLHGAPGATTKERSLFVAREVLGLHPANDHEADAAHILRYAVMQGTGAVTRESQAKALRQIANDRGSARRRRSGGR